MNEGIIVQNKFTKWWFTYGAKGFVATTLYPFIFAKEKLSDEHLVHERIHLAQQRELWVVGFYFLYLLEYVRNRKMYSKFMSYKQISFEQEAYANSYNKQYLKNRKKHAWKKYRSIADGGLK